jgi:thiamine biosynthesis lipoprotein
MQEVFALAEETKNMTHGYFDIHTADGTIDPAGLVKGWAINNAAKLLDTLGCKNFQVDAGGDIQSRGKNAEGGEWSIGIRNPFHLGEIIKVVYPHGQGVATSGTYIRGKHIYDPRSGEPVETDILSLTVVGPDIYEADRFATAAFAMGERGIEFIENLYGFEGYAVNEKGVAVMTSGFTSYTSQ